MSYDFDLLSDLHKDAYGFRPSRDFIDAFLAMVESDQQAHWDQLCRAVDDSIAEEKRLSDAALTAYDARIDGMISDYGIDRSTAIRWDMDAFGVELQDDDGPYVGGYNQQAIEFYLWEQGIDFSEMPSIIAEINRTV